MPRLCGYEELALRALRGRRARTAAAIYTLVGSCMLQGIDPGSYLYDLLCRLLDHLSRDIAALTPRNWRRARELHTA